MSTPRVLANLPVCLLVGLWLFLLSLGLQLLRLVLLPPHLTPQPHSRGEDEKKEGSDVGFGLFD